LYSHSLQRADRLQFLEAKVKEGRLRSSSPYLKRRVERELAMTQRVGTAKEVERAYRKKKYMVRKMSTKGVRKKPATANARR
jgi:hypothetical protein